MKGIDRKDGYRTWEETEIMDALCRQQKNGRWASRVAIGQVEGRAMVG